MKPERNEQTLTGRVQVGEVERDQVASVGQREVVGEVALAHGGVQEIVHGIVVRQKHLVRVALDREARCRDRDDNDQIPNPLLTS